MSGPGSLATQAERQIETQALGVMERAAAGANTGTYAVSHLGPRWASTLVSLALRDPAAERAYFKFVRASLNFEFRRDQASQIALAKRVLHLDELVSKASGIQASEVSALRRDLHQYLQAVRQVDKESVAAAEKILAATAKRKATRLAVDGLNVQREIVMASGRVKFFDMVAALSHGGVDAVSSDALFLQAYRKVCTTMGADLGKGWKQVFEYLADNVEAAQAYRHEIERLTEVIAKEKDPLKQAFLRDRALPATIRRGIHSKVKGLMGERFFTLWSDWRLIKSSYMDLARRVTAQLGRDWEAVPVAGKMFLGGKETWDEAILLVNRRTIPPQAKLFMAAQVKVALEARSLSQTVNDLAREAATKDLRIVLADGDEAWYLLSPLPAGKQPIRWVSNAAGGEIPMKDIAALFKAGIEVHQKTIPVSIEEFNIVADRLIQAFVEAL